MRAFLSSHFHLSLILCLCIGAIVSSAASWLRHDSARTALLHGGLFLVATLTVLFHPVLTVAWIGYLCPIGAQNALATWPRAALGKEGYDAFVRDLVRKGGIAVPVTCVLVAAGFFGMLAGWLYLLSTPAEWGYWMAMGIGASALTSGVAGLVHFVRVRRSLTSS